MTRRSYQTPFDFAILTWTAMVSLAALLIVGGSIISIRAVMGLAGWL